MISNSTSSELSYIEKLPTEIIGNILVQMIDITGSKNIINKSDLPVLAKYQSRLGSTSRTMYSKVNCVHVTNLFLKTLSQKFELPPEEIAAKLNNPAARSWLLDYIEMRGLDKIYKAVQEIYKLAGDAINLAKQAGLSYYGNEIKYHYSDAYSQTKTGIALEISNSPQMLITPFGRFVIYSEIMFPNPHTGAAVSELFIQRLRGILVKVGKSDDLMTHVFELQAPAEFKAIRKLESNHFKYVEKNQLIHKIGTNNLIISANPNFISTYGVRKVDQTNIEPWSFHDNMKSKQKSEQLCSLLLELLKNNQLNDNSSINSAKKSKTDTEMKSEIIFNDLTEIISWTFSFFTQLAEKPYLENKEIEEKIKYIPIKDDFQFNFMHSLVNQIQKILGDSLSWNIITVGPDNYTQFSDKVDFDNGFVLIPTETMCDSETLKNTITRIFETLKSITWTKSLLENHPTIIFRKSEEEYDLFIQNQANSDLDLITPLADLLGLTNFTLCHSIYDDVMFANKPMYLWVRKDKLEEVKDKLQLKI